MKSETPHEPPPRLRRALRFESPPAAFPPPLPMQEPAWQAGDPVPGTQYRYVRELGQGVQGLAIEVEHAFLGARAAMKILRAQHVSRRSVADRVRDEARALVELRHPNIVRVTDGGMTAERESRPFFVMELLKGDTLRAQTKKAGGALGVRETLDVAIDILDALDHAHARHMVHRDVKPANIFLARGNPGPRAILLDFGIASVVEPGGDNRAGFSGTYEYAAPEQLDGYLTAQSDVYALATVMYVCLAGRHPFAGVPREELARMQRHVVPPALDRVQAEVPAALAELVARAMEKDPARRPKSAFAFAQKLRDIRTSLRTPQRRVLPVRAHDEPSRVGTTDQLLRDLRPGNASEAATEEGTTLAREPESVTSQAATLVRGARTTSVLVAPWLPPIPLPDKPVRPAQPGRPRRITPMPMARPRGTGSGPITVTGPRSAAPHSTERSHVPRGLTLDLGSSITDEPLPVAERLRTRTSSPPVDTPAPEPVSSSPRIEVRAWLRTLLVRLRPHLPGTPLELALLLGLCVVALGGFVAIWVVTAAG